MLHPVEVKIAVDPKKTLGFFEKAYLNACEVHPVINIKTKMAN
jgi:hypothetical protein